MQFFIKIEKQCLISEVLTSKITNIGSSGNYFMYLRVDFGLGYLAGRLQPNLCFFSAHANSRKISLFQKVSVAYFQTNPHGPTYENNVGIGLDFKEKGKYPLCVSQQTCFLQSYNTNKLLYLKSHQQYSVYNLYHYQCVCKMINFMFINQVK